MNGSDIITLIGNVGFPIAVSIYLLVRIEGKMEALTNSINNLTNTIVNSNTKNK
ncbi:MULTISPECIES: YvrJ family protein [Clostridium]|uniref:YvrJ family protein n=1 Tax=Clostridium TaxID=1485 RepID=UPI00082422B9|nr:MULTISPECIES: YvrJ family protein [Clostridium]PJI10541.1 YvrJ family protein [Clostridium sp. CT7]